MIIASVRTHALERWEKMLFAPEKLFSLVREDSAFDRSARIHNWAE